MVQAEPHSRLIAQGQQYVLRLYGQKQDTRLTFHNYALSEELLSECGRLCAEEGLAPEVAEQAMLAALFYPIGHTFDYEAPAPYAVKLARQFLEHMKCPEEAQKGILHALQRALRLEPPDTAVGRVLQDALHSLSFLSEPPRSPLLRLELELLRGQPFTKASWAKYWLDAQLRTKWHTRYGQAVLQPRLANAIYQQRAEVEKRQEKEEVLEGRYTALEKKIPVRGAQTFFRTNYRNHINLSAIADNKANIMISVNAILVSVLITFLSYRNIGENDPKILLPVIVFLVTGLASLIFAVLSARPKVTRLNPSGQASEAARQNLVFFGNFVTLELEEYEAAMDELFQDAELLYGNMVRDLYFLGKVLDKKYRYLSISYTIFMVGFAATVLSFLALLFV
ncbi:Pycsar system effector family protein [Phaeodactylibacter luteus]|uniref:Pycsar effector protein domain-containing protein n=1 Tax=Phaeodactylibacter luteus TaxID=1564516 RepID=A0A5C6RHJ4_9BACT|nr:Pycsar system effector family protein [Phaeodactylibacter luteus]TXB61627.1 hypothetical protein FRY97_18055 [Phaeodactylibacter luteus]